MLGAQVPDVREQVPGVKCQVAIARGQVPGARLQVLGVRFLMPGTMEVGAKFLQIFTLAFFCYHKVSRLEVPAAQNITKHQRRYKFISQNMSLK